jgi:hypothetical protein
MARVDPFAKAAQERAAAELVTGWTDERLADLGAVDALVASWGLERPAAWRLVDAERRKRGLK